MTVVYAKESIPKTEEFKLFLAGPLPRVKGEKTWREEVKEFFKNSKIILLTPELRDNKYEEGILEKESQILWEHEAMTHADFILFWIPRTKENLGLTTNEEFGYWKALRPSKMIVGIPPNSFRTDYQKFWTKKLKIPFFETLQDTLKYTQSLL